MKTLLKTAALSVCLGLLFMVDVPPEFPLHVEFVPEAHAIFGVRRRAFRRGAVVGASAAAVTDAAVVNEAYANDAAAASQPAAAPAPAPAPAPAASSNPLPLGTVVSSLPAGCTSTPVGGVDYFYCGGNFYKAAFQGNNLVYVTTKP
jgi:hypothetical protein